MDLRMRKLRPQGRKPVSLRRMLERWGWACRWCGGALLTLQRAAELGAVESHSRDTVTWVDCAGRRHVTPRVTVDRVKPRCEEDEDDLVPACAPCNRTRTQAPYAHTPRTAAACRHDS